MSFSGIKITKNNVPQMEAAINRLLRISVLVGIPDTDAGRKPTAEEPHPASNAVIGYVMETGDPAKNIPARPFLVPGVTSIHEAVTAGLETAARHAIAGDTDAMNASLNRLGIRAVSAVRSKITEGPFVPLSPMTIAARRRATLSPTLQAIRDAGQVISSKTHADLSGARPLIDTGQLRNAITWVLRARDNVKRWVVTRK